MGACSTRAQIETRVHASASASASTAAPQPTSMAVQQQQKGVTASAHPTSAPAAAAPSSDPPLRDVYPDLFSPTPAPRRRPTASPAASGERPRRGSGPASLITRATADAAASPARTRDGVSPGDRRRHSGSGGSARGRSGSGGSARGASSLFAPQARRGIGDSGRLPSTVGAVVASAVSRVRCVSETAGGDAAAAAGLAKRAHGLFCRCVCVCVFVCMCSDEDMCVCVYERVYGGGRVGVRVSTFLCVRAHVCG